MLYFQDFSEYRHGLAPTFWAAHGPPDPRPDGLYLWLWDVLAPEPAFDAPEVNIGWLDRQHQYPQGPTGAEFRAILRELCDESLYHRTRGNRPCELCNKVLSGRFGSSEVRVRGQGVVFAAPNLVYHYVTEHDYAPPQDFIDSIVESRGQQAQPVPGTRRPIPPELLIYRLVDVDSLQRQVLEEIKNIQYETKVLDISVSTCSGCFLVEAQLVGYPGTDPLKGSWLIPPDAILNLDQGASGIGSMLINACNQESEKYYPSNKKGV